MTRFRLILAALCVGCCGLLLLDGKEAVAADSPILRWQNGEGPYKRSDISVGVDIIDKWKVITSYVGYDHAGNPGKDGRRRVLSKIDILPAGTICTETYLVIGAYDDEEQAQNLVTYMKTHLFRFLMSQFMYSHHITKDSYAFVPILDVTKSWTDAKLYKRYGLTEEEIAFIESKIRPMEANGEDAAGGDAGDE